MAAPDFRTLRYFVAVAEERSVGKAARRLNMAQPPLSVHIRNLEASVGTPLFQRTARGMAPTEHGQCLARYAREILGRLSSAREEMLDISVANRLRPTAIHGMLRPPRK